MAGSMRGIITVLNTPFTESDAIDVEGLKRNVALALEAGVAGFLVPALASEVDFLAQEERILLVATVVESVGGRAPVIGGASSATQDERVRLGKAYLELGCRGLLVQLPGSDPDAIERDLRELADLGPGFLMLQDWDPRGSGIPVSLICRLFRKIPAFSWLKIEVAFAGAKYSKVLDATQGRLNVAGGWAVMQMIEALDRGVHAIMPTGMHRIYTEIYRRYASGNRESARDLFGRLVPVLAFANQQLDVSIHFFKRLLHAQGTYATARVRTPGVRFDEHHERIAEELIRRVQELETALAQPHDSTSKTPSGRRGSPSGR